MTLTMSHGPLSGHPSATNYQIDGPEHRLFFDDFPRRVRAIFAGETILDSRRGQLLHETGILPQIYVPRDDVRFELLDSTKHRTHCPFKGDAAYWSMHTGDRVVENAAWAYPQPRETAPWLRDYVAFYWSSMDAWFDEDEEVEGHLRDPYHRIDVRETNRHLRVTIDGEAIAETDRPKILSETGLPNRFYIPPRDVRYERLEPSAKHTICPYKGTASYHTVRVGDRRIADAAWAYPKPLEDAFKVRDHLCFSAEGVTIEVDGKPVE
jgi:uncharacterized protein (DUF427 family)